MRENVSFIYIAFHKPYGVLSDYAPGETRETYQDYVKLPGLFPAGRLDLDSEGLLLLTNDGPMAHRLADPRYHHPKTYLAQVEGDVTPEALALLSRGVEIKGGYQTRPILADIIPPPGLPPRRSPVTPNGPTAWLRLVLTEGKKRQIRQMTAAVGFPTLRLYRTAIGPVQLGDLQPGAWRHLTPEELKSLN